MKIQYASDLHTEQMGNKGFIRSGAFDVVGDVLVLAGDTTVVGNKNSCFDEFAKWASDNYKEVFLLFGNHEYFNDLDLDKTLSNFELELLPNVRFINNKSVLWGDCELFFSTLWADIPFYHYDEVKSVMKDFIYVNCAGKMLNLDSYNHSHQICKNYLIDAISKSTKKTKVVCTHHAPKIDSSMIGAISTAFFVNVDKIFQLEPTYWIHGHTHNSKAEFYNKTWVLSNQLGYLQNGEGKGFKKNKFIEIT